MVCAAMRILYAAMKYDYGKPEHGFSFEHYNFYYSLLHMGHDILYFDYMTLMHQHGRDRMNRRLKEVVALEKPDLLFSVLFTDQFDPLVLREFTETRLPTVNWFCDDHWRFDNYSSEWAHCFKWVITTAASALPKYASLGYRNVIKSQWGCNDVLYRKMDVPLKYDVAFVGQPHGNRRQVIHTLRKAGINVHVWGGGWESGRLSQEEMIRVFNQSRINLNLSNASMPTSALPPVLTHTAHLSDTVRGRLSRSLDVIPFGLQVKAMGKGWLSGLRDPLTASIDPEPTETSEVHYSDQIKGRNFEVPGCGGFLLTGMAENLGEYYEIGKEVAHFSDRHDLVEKVRYYLKHEDERAAIAQAGYERTLREHTYVHRFRDIFGQMGLSGSSVKDLADLKAQPGSTQEVQ
jgi:spore maturation protein CgeB